jgi:hypothetical protein
MYDMEKFVPDFLAAAKDNDEEKMKELSKLMSTETIESRIKYLEEITKGLKESGDNKDVEAGLVSTLELIRLAQEANENSSGVEGKDNSKPEEDSKDESAGTSAETTEMAEGHEGVPVSDAPTEEEKMEKSESDK